MEHGNSYELVWCHLLSSSLTFIDATSSMGTITWRAIPYFKHANIDFAQPQTVYIQGKYSGCNTENPFKVPHQLSILNLN